MRGAAGGAAAIGLAMSAAAGAPQPPSATGRRRYWRGGVAGLEAMALRQAGMAAAAGTDNFDSTGGKGLGSLRLYDTG